MSIFASVKRMFTSTPEPAPEPAPKPARRKGSTHNRFRPGTREHVADLYRRGYRVSAIARWSGVSEARIYQVLHDDNVAVRPRGRNAAARRRADALPPLPPR